MPWVIAKENEEWCLYKQGADGQAEGETLACHPTEDEAKAQMAALYANMGQEAERAIPDSEIRRTGVMGYARAFKAKDPPADGRVWYVAATEGVKRDGLDLKIADFSLDEFRAYPIILFGHDYMGRNLPIGLGEPRVVNRELHMGIEFDEGDPFAMQVKSKAEKGMIAGSIGWEDIEVKGETRHNLMEFSLVPLPADPKSLPIQQARALRSLADALDRLDIGDSQPAETGELDWQEVATAMVRSLTPTSDEPEEARLSAYNALLPKYRRLGKVAPEFLDAATLSALGPAERRGLFLAGEPDLLPEAFAKPEVPKGADDGAVTTTALADIQARLSALEERPRIAEQRILAGILAKLQAAQPEPPSALVVAGGDDGNEQSVTSDTPNQSLQAILEKLESLT